MVYYTRINLNISLLFTAALTRQLTSFSDPQTYNAAAVLLAKTTFNHDHIQGSLPSYFRTILPPIKDLKVNTEIAKMEIGLQSVANGSFQVLLSKTKRFHSGWKFPKNVSFYETFLFNFHLLRNYFVPFLDLIFRCKMRLFKAIINTVTLMQ